MEDVIKYDFSFTASSLRRNDMVMVAKNLIGREKLNLEQELGRGKGATGKRILRECNKRIAKLTHEQIDLLIDGDLITQNHMAFLAICKLHSFIRDFVVDVVREKLLVYDYGLTEGEYISFYRRKAELHSEMESLKESTQRKIKQVTFKILEQAGLIDGVKTKVIQAQILDHKVCRTIVSDDKEWLKVFLLTDQDINSWTEY
ncbi:BrxA family protein [Saccharicrinis fermentans]|uniref:Inner membrane protein n=1 Tax=Saccharicrinis fermentans DSM 9555 = JCM 21142 TaxID=869213 RepID=W7Y8R8_9BACT|nr:BrxA family protein [Saccharicrinis fermentans]GAF04632.1 hypothetical protein JCM21142_93344 [Saccharicrinis fermentans DSM 9555 = JCM 21142]